MWGDLESSLYRTSNYQHVLRDIRRVKKGIPHKVLWFITPERAKFLCLSPGRETLEIFHWYFHRVVKPWEILDWGFHQVEKPYFHRKKYFLNFSLVFLPGRETFVTKSWNPYMIEQRFYQNRKIFEPIKILSMQYLSNL